jgi:stage II sporulation protein D
MEVSQFSPTGNVVSVTMTDSNGRRHVFSRRTQLITALGVPTQRFNIGSQRWEPGAIFVNDPALPVDSGIQRFAIDGNGETTAVPGDNLVAITGTGDVASIAGETTGSGGSSTNLVNGVFTIRGTGRGHSVGMSQWGAFSMAHYHNMTFEDIIKFYFTGVEITQAEAR